MARASITYDILANDKTKSALGNVEKNFKRAGAAGVKAFASVGTGAVAGLTALGLQASKTADNIGKLSTQLNISAESLSGLKFVAEQTGVEFKALSISLQRQARRVSEAAIGTGEAKDALRELGVEATALNQLRPDEQFEKLGQAILKVKNPTDQVRLAFKLWDSEGVRNLRTIKALGTEGFDPLIQRATELGAVIDGRVTERAADLQGGFNEVKTAAQGLGFSLVDTLGPALSDASKGFATLIAQTRQALEAFGLLEARDTRGRLAQLIDEQLKLQKELTEEERKAAESRSIVGRTAAEERVTEILAEQKAIQEERNAIQAEFNRLIGEGLGITEATNNAIKAVRNGEGEEGQNNIEEDPAVAFELAKQERLIQANRDFASQIEAIDQQSANKRKSINASLYAGLAGQVAGALKSMLGDSKAAAVAGVAIDAGMAAAKIVIGGAVAAQGTIAAYAQLAAAFPLAAPAIIAQGASVAAGQVAAANALAVKAAAITFGGGVIGVAAGGGGGGSAPGSSGGGLDPISSADDDFITDRTTQPTNVISIDFSGGITDTNAVREFIENDFAEALRDGSGLDVQVVAV